MSASSSTGDTNNEGDSSLDEICTVSGKYQDFSSTIKFFVDSIKERFDEEKRTDVDSHDFKVNDEEFYIKIRIDKRKQLESSEEQRWLGVFLYKKDIAPTGRPKVSFKIKFLNVDRQDIEYSRQVFERSNHWGWMCLLTRRNCEGILDNTLNLLCTVTLHSKEKDILSTKRSRSSSTLVEDEELQEEESWPANIKRQALY